MRDMFFAMPSTHAETIYALAAILVAKLCYTYVVFKLCIRFIPSYREIREREKPPQGSLSSLLYRMDREPMVFLVGLPVLLVLAYAEEVLFRQFPLGVAGIIQPDGITLRLLTVVASACVFSVVHADAEIGLRWWQTLPFHGVGGLVYGFAYLKFGGMEGKDGDALMAVTPLHFSFNVALTLVALVRHLCTRSHSASLRREGRFSG